MAGNALHYGVVRYICEGAGVLISTLRDASLTIDEVLADITLTTPATSQPRIIANFVMQRAVLKIEQTAIDDFMDFDSITIYVKPLWSELPNA
jgi:hypothetical protein